MSTGFAARWQPAAAAPFCYPSVLLHLRQCARAFGHPYQDDGGGRPTCKSVDRGVAQPGRAPGSGPGGRRFESSLPDQFLQSLRENPKSGDFNLAGKTAATVRLDPFFPLAIDVLRHVVIGVPNVVARDLRSRSHPQHQA